MAVTREMMLVRLEDLAPFAEARELARQTRELHAHAPPAPAREGCRALLAQLARTALAVVATVAEALRAGEPREELRRFRDAQLALHELRALAYESLAHGALRTRDFDAIMAGSARALREIDACMTAARRRGCRRLDFVDE